MIDGTKLQIGNDVLLNVGVNSDWYISSASYSRDPKEVTITLREKETERSEWDIIREIIEDKADVESVVRGEWVSDGALEVCINCGEVKEFPHWNYCPNCGVKMAGGKRTE